MKNRITPHKLPIVHIPNSHIEQHDDSGKLIRIRYYDDHGKQDTHKVQHTHIIEIGTIICRKKELFPPPAPLIKSTLPISSVFFFL